jgi:iron(III) transport system permease protein
MLNPKAGESLSRSPELTLKSPLKKQSYLARNPLQSVVAFIIGITLVLFIVTPIVYVLIRSFGGAGGFTLEYYQNFFARPYYYRALTNSLTLATTVTIIVVTFCFMYAYIVARLPKGFTSTVMRSIALLPLLAPPFIFSISLITLGGRRGIISQALASMFGIEFSIYGWTGVILAQCIGLFPLGFMMLENVLRSMDLNLEEASADMGAGQWRTLFSVTIPLMMPGIMKAALLVFIKSIADFATPMVIGRGLPFLATDAYLLVVGQHNMEMAAVLATFLIMPTMIIFFIQNYILTDKTRTTIGSQSGGTAQIRMDPLMKGIFTVGSLLSILLIVSAFGIVFWSAFVVIPGVNNTFTLAHFSTRTGLTALVTSLKIASSAALLVAFMAVIQAYLNIRLKVPGSKLMEYIALFGMGVPGTVIGIGFILTFNQQPLKLTGTMFIIVMAIMCQYLGVSLEAGISKLHQIGPSMEEASWDMGASKAMTFFRIILPLMGSSFLYGLIFTFMSAMTTISAIIFLVYPGTTLAAVYILQVAEQGAIARAAAMSVVLITIVALSLFILNRLTARTHLSRL